MQIALNGKPSDLLGIGDIVFPSLLAGYSLHSDLKKEANLTNPIIDDSVAIDPVKVIDILYIYNPKKCLHLSLIRTVLLYICKAKFVHVSSFFSRVRLGLLALRTISDGVGTACFDIHCSFYVPSTLHAIFNYIC